MPPIAHKLTIQVLLVLRNQSYSLRNGMESAITTAMGKQSLLVGVIIALSWAANGAQGSPICEDLFNSKPVQYEITAANQELVYVSDFSHGLSPSRDLKRFESLGISPKLNVIWFSPNKKTHIQAMAFDSNGKKQYFYHPAWESVRNKIKYDKLKSFGEVLPYIRRQLRKEINFPGFTRTRALAALVMLLDQTGSHSLPAMTRKQLKKKDGKYYLILNGDLKVEIKDDRVISYLQESLSQPGDHLFKYIDEDRNMRFIVNSSVDEYLKNVSGLDVSAKNFKAWIGTVSSAEFLYNANRNDEKIISKAVQFAADKLGNSKAVMLENYVHPQIFVTFMEGKPFNKAFRDAEGDAEAAVLYILAGAKDEE